MPVGTSNDRDSITKAIVVKNVQLDDLPHATFRALSNYLFDSMESGQPQVIHFDGHGAFGRVCSNGHLTTSASRSACEQCGRSLPPFAGYLAFEREDGLVHWVSGEDFANKLRDYGVRLAVLSACQSGTARRGDDVFNGAAQNVLRSVPAVVATQFRLDWQGATLFADYFYRGLAAGQPLVEIIDRTRQALYGQDGIEREWYRPVLYLRQRDDSGGRLFIKMPGAGTSWKNSQSPLSPAGPRHRPRSSYPLQDPPRKLVGRSSEVNQLVQATQQEGYNVCVISGMGGIGKTALARSFAQEIRQHYPDGQKEIDLRGMRDKNVSPAKVMLNLIRDEDPDFNWNGQLEIDDDLLKNYRSLFEDRRVLLVLDDAADYLHVDKLIPQTGTCLTIITSRRHFNPPGWFYVPLDRLTADDACKLLCMVESQRGNSRVKESEAIEIARLCGHLPLALEIAGAFLGLNTCTVFDYITELSVESKRLERLEVDGYGDRYRTRAVFNLSYAQLQREKGDLVARWLSLTTFPATFDKVVVTAIWDVADRQWETQQLLDEFKNRSMLQYSKTDMRYSLHELVRLFASSFIPEYFTLSDQVKYSQRHARHYLGVLHDVNALYQEGDDSLYKGLRKFDLEWDNIEAGFTRTVAYINNRKHTGLSEMVGNDRNAVEICKDYPTAAPQCLELRLSSSQRIHWLESAMDAACLLGDCPQIQIAQLLISRGHAYADLGDNQLALDCYVHALDIAQEESDLSTKAIALGSLGNIYYCQGDVRNAVTLYEQQLSFARQIPDYRGESDALGNLGNAYAELGQVHESVSFYKQQIKVAFWLGDTRRESIARRNLGAVYLETRDYELARSLFQRSLSMAKESAIFEARQLHTLTSAILPSLTLKKLKLLNPMRRPWA